MYQIVDCDQNSPEWHEARLGLITASVVGSLITPKTMSLADNATSNDLLCSLKEEREYGYPYALIFPQFETFAMREGKRLEEIAADYIQYEVCPDRKFDKCGFVRSENGLFGCSPDMVELDFFTDEIISGCEIKCMQEGNWKKYKRNCFTSEDLKKLNFDYYAQCNFCMYVLETNSWSFSFYADSPLLPKKDRCRVIDLYPDQKLFEVFKELETKFSDFLNQK